MFVFLVAGLIGHDPWKQDEAYLFGMIDHLLNSGDWVVPMVAGEPFMEKPPLYTWVAAFFARLFSPWLALHDGARLATGFFMLVTSASVAWTARQWWGPRSGRYAVLALLSCLGLVTYSHLMLTDVPLLTGFAIATCGLAIAPSRQVTGGVLLGVGVGIGFLAKGLLAPGVVGLTAILLPIFFSNWRKRIFYLSLGIAFIVALPFLVIWPAALYMRSPELFMDWFWLNNIGRFIGFSVPSLGAEHDSHFWLRNLPWFTFPALPLALATLWRERRSILHKPAFQCCCMMSGIVLVVLALSASARPNYGLPLLLPLALLAAPAIASLPPMVDCGWDWGARALFGMLALAIWAVWIALRFHSQPVHWAWLGRYLPLDFVPATGPGVILIAPLLTFMALALVWRGRKGPGRGALSWLVGLTLCWALISALWLDWIDYARSYRSVFASMGMALPAQQRCIASIGLGESERAMLKYFLKLDTYRREVALNADCDLLLVNGTVAAPPKGIDAGSWRLFWEGARPGDNRERFWLYVQAPHDSKRLSADAGPLR